LSQLLLCDKTFGHIRQYYASFCSAVAAMPSVQNYVFNRRMLKLFFLSVKIHIWCRLLISVSQI